MDQFIGLSNREREVVKLLLEGKSNKQIALSFHIIENTVEFHLKNIYSKYQVSSRTEMIIKLGISVVAGKGENPMTFYESILVCFKKYAEFNGRASRSEFWWFTMFIVLVASALTYVSQTLGTIFLIAILLPLLAAGTRRLRDSGKSRWWQLFLLAPVAGLVLVGFLWAQPTTSPQPDNSLSA